MITSLHNRQRMMAGLELLLCSVLAIQAARLLWGVLAPVAAAVPASAAPPLQPAAALSGFDPFFPDASGPESGTALLQGWTLSGIRRAVDPSASTAILSQDGQPQSAFRVGDQVAPGLVLQAVASDHVLLAHGSATQRLALPDDAQQPAPPGTALPSAAPPAAPAPAGDGRPMAVDPRELFTGTGLRANRENGRVSGYTVMPGNDEALLRRAGLQPGDVLLDVNGRPLEPGRLLELADELRGNPQARVTFRRDGQTHTIDLGGQAP